MPVSIQIYEYARENSGSVQDRSEHQGSQIGIPSLLQTW